MKKPNANNQKLVNQKKCLIPRKWQPVHLGLISPDCFWVFAATLVLWIYSLQPLCTWIMTVQCEIDCSKTVKIVAWVICSRMAELCTAQSCMANFILIHQTTVQCVVCYSNYNCAILWNAAPLSTMLQPKDKAETVIQHPTTFHFHFLTQDWSTSSNFLIIFHVHTFSDPIWCSDGKFFFFGQNVLLGKVVKQLQGLF